MVDYNDPQGLFEFREQQLAIQNAEFDQALLNDMLGMDSDELDVLYSDEESEGDTH